MEETFQYVRWFKRLKDSHAKLRIAARIARIEECGQLLGDWKPVGDGVLEMRFMFGPGYRIYASLQGHRLLLLLFGGEKSAQASDIEKAKRILKRWKRNHEG